MDEIFLICLPFAGGNKYSYREYAENSPSFLKLITLEYPGRGGRLKEPLVTDVNHLVDDLYHQIKSAIGHKKYALYGHSMGGLLASLLAQRIAVENNPLPILVFITGTTGPAARLVNNEVKKHLLSKADFLNEIKNLQGMPDEILENKDLLDYFEPILRADFEVCENYIYREFKPLPIPYTVITGYNEKMPAEEIQLWQKETEIPVDFMQLPGSHFFIFKNSKLIVDIISKKLYNQFLTYQK